MFLPYFIYFFLGFSSPASSTNNTTNSDGIETPGNPNDNGETNTGDNGQLPPPKIEVTNP